MAGKVLSPKEHFEWQLSLTEEEKEERQEYFEALFERLDDVSREVTTH